MVLSYLVKSAKKIGPDDLHKSLQERQKEQNRTEIYDALDFLRKATVSQIQLYLKKEGWEIDKRTIQRHIKSDPRIIRQKRFYYIDENSRYEIRYFRPQTFGSNMLVAAFQNFPSRYKVDVTKSLVTKVNASKVMEEYIKRFGFLLVFCFIEASRPFKDKNNKMTPREREHLVKYWINNSVPLREMFGYLRAEFASLAKKYEQLKMKQKHLRIQIPSELDDSEINFLSQILKSSNPELYERLMAERSLSRKWFTKS